tara:strand:- start:238181 stop:238456 length:276 start_codon:yes stop_codon:yes gene_type:complete
VFASLHAQKEPLVFLFLIVRTIRPWGMPAAVGDVQSRFVQAAKFGAALVVFAIAVGAQTACCFGPSRVLPQMREGRPGDLIAGNGLIALPP